MRAEEKGRFKFEAFQMTILVCKLDENLSVTLSAGWQEWLDQMLAEISMMKPSKNWSLWWEKKNTSRELNVI